MGAGPVHGIVCPALAGAILLGCAGMASAQTSPLSALAAVSAECGGITPENLVPLATVPEPWQPVEADAHHARAVALLVAHDVNRRIADNLLDLEEWDEEFEFSLEMHLRWKKGEGHHLLHDGAGAVLHILGSTEHLERFHNRACTLIVPMEAADIIRITAEFDAALPFVTSGIRHDLRRWTFDAGYGAGESREAYGRSAFIYQGDSTAPYWGLSWTAEGSRQ